MKKLLLSLTAIIGISMFANAQCTSSNATTCVCPPGGGTNCDLLPDIKASVDALQGSYTVYTQTGNAASGSQGSNDGRLRLTGTTPNIGYGPLDTRSINKWLCGTDTLLFDPGSLCPDGRVPKRFVNQRIYHKNGNTMSFTDVPCGTLTYHPSHGHMHVDNWGIYSLRIQNPNDPNPLNWSIVGTGTKLAFCLLDIGSCANSPTYCRDDNNNPLTTAQIPNNTIGAGNYGCSSTLQGISNGYYDTYSQSLDGMWIDIPTGTCNGQYYVVVQIDPNQNMTELNENNNVIAVPVTISNQSAAGSPVIKISANKPGTLVPGNNITLTATAGSSYLWSPGGATTQSITVSTAGSYTCTVTNYCGTATSAPFVVTTLPAAPTPSSAGASICSGASATITATNGGTGTMKWYSSAVAATSLVTGASYTTIPLTSTTTYYLENEVTTTGATTHVGPVDNTIGATAFQTLAPSPTWYEQFDAVSDLTLVSVKVFASVSGSRTFILQDRASTVLKSQSIFVPAIGANVITLNWFVPAGAGYKLMVSGAPNLYYNTSGVSYPYSAPGICNIFGSYSGHTNYTYFYDFVVKSPDLVAKSGRIPVTVNVASSIVVFINAAPPSLCQGQSTTLIATGASSYSWSPGGATTSNIVVSPASTTVYTVTGTSAACSDVETITIDVNPLPSVSASNVSGCSGSPIALTGSPAGGTWSVANPYTGASTSYNYTYTDAHGCTNTSSNATITVNPLPTVTANSVSGCAGSSIALSGSPAGGTWSLANPYSGASTTYTHSYTDANGCTNTSSSASINVNALPTVTAGNVSGCAGSSIALIGSPAGGTWSQPNPYTGVSSSYTYSYTDGNGCSNSSANSSITVNPLPTVTTGNVSGCAGSSIALSGSPAGGTWNQTNPYTGPSASYSYSYTDGNGCSNSSTSNITVNPLPTLSTSSTSVGCFGGSNGSATAVASGGTPGYSYSWNTSPVQNTSTATGLSSGSYAVTVTDANGCTATQSQSVSAPSALTSSANVTNTTCGFSNGAIDMTPSGGTAPYSYSWTPGGASSQDLSGIAGGSYSVQITDANGCIHSNTFSVATSGTAPSSPVSVSGNDFICKGTLGNSYSVASVAGATSYVWSVPSGATIGSGQGTTALSIDFSATQTSGTVCVYASNVCGNSAPVCKTLNVVTAKPGIPSSISGPSINCVGTSGVSFSCPSVANAQSYNWTVPTGVTIVSGAGTNAIVVDFGSGYVGGYLRVSASNCAGTSSQRTITLYSKPATPGVISGSVNGLCAGTLGVAYSVASVTAASSYTWTAPANATIASGQGTNSVTIDYGATFTSGSLIVTANNLCGSSPIRSTTIRSVPLSPGAVTGTTTACANQAGVAYSIAAVTGATSYSWTAPVNASIVSVQGTTSVTIDYSNSFSGGTLKVTANNLCGSGPARSVTIRSIPSLPGTVTGSATVCANQTGVAYSVAAVTGATSYAWTVPAGAVVATGQGTNSITVNFGASGGNVSVQAANTCGSSMMKNFAVTVNCRQVAPADQFSLYPNPAHDKINIAFYTTTEGQYNILINDVTGRKVYASAGSALNGQNQKEISLADFAKGIYMLSFEINGEQRVQKVVIE
ncbi:MAG: T9SS type A sorting domain-containing protein [Bacteroidetes bacterium]|nr:T9SS type A sorting domain-containing protein [Bacteroidota bacterium]